MKLKYKNILLISPEPWNHIFVSKHHYAVYLARLGNTVYFLNPPSSSWLCEQTNFENVFSVSYKGFPIGLRYYPKWIQRYIIRIRYKSLQALCGKTFNIVWSFDNSVFFDFGSLPAEVVKISHIVDYSQDFQLAKASRSADFCFCSSEVIKQKLLKHNPKTFKIPHGFNSPAKKPEIKLRGDHVIKVVYSGNLSIPYIDWNMLEKLVIENENVDFIFFGPIDKGISKPDCFTVLSKQNHCHFYGVVPADELQGYYAAADILIICYEEELQSTQLTAPHKMMEYLGSGKMVVCTYTAEYEMLANEELILMAKRNIDFPSLFSEAICRLPYWNSDEKINARKLYAMDNTYERQIERIESILDK